MPMQWTAENDRLLLLKLIETHGISVNADKIRAAWPKDAANVPTARAITERFVKIRLQAGVPKTPNKSRVKMSTAAPPSGRMSLTTTPASASKRKQTPKKKSVNTESDAEGHMTPSSSDEVPTPKSRKVNSGRAAKVGGRDASTARIKTEPEEDPFQSSIAQHLEQATALNVCAQNNGNAWDDGLTYDNYGYQTAGFGQGNPFASGIGLDGVNGRMNGGLGSTLGMMNMDMASSSESMQGTQKMHVPGGFPITPKPKPKPGPTRSTKRAGSHQSSQRIANLLEMQKEMDKEDGERSSVEMSDESVFQEDEEEFIV